MDTHHLVIDPGLRPRTSTLPDERSDDGGGDLLPETEGVAATLPQAGPEALPTGRGRRRARLMAGVALGVVLLAAGGAFMISPFNTVYPLDLGGTATRLRGAVETARQAIMPAQRAPELIAPAARIATAPDPVPVPPVQRETPARQPVEEQVREIIGFQTPPAHPAARVTEPVPLARRLGETPQRADAGAGAARAAASPAATAPAAPSAPHGMAAVPPSPASASASASAGASSPEESGTAMATMPATPTLAAARPEGPPPATVPAPIGLPPASAVPGNPPGAPAPEAPRPAPASVTAPVAGGIAMPAPVAVNPVPVPAGNTSQGATPDPGAIAAHLRPAPMSTPQQVEVLGLVTAIGTMVRDLREENRQLRADMAAARGRIEESVADLSRRVALAEARGAVAVAMGGPEPTAVAVPAVARGAPSVAPAAPRTAVAAPRADDVRRRYRVQAASPGLAMLSEVDNSSESGVQLQVAVGDQVPGYGRITAIAQQGATWVVRTERGNIQ
ncbi:MAG: hypothetical protein E7K72_00145 [Roseomonas mucosa]|nr:hypothetical protein [Roseomonas mucosa]